MAFHIDDLSMEQLPFRGSITGYDVASGDTCGDDAVLGLYANENSHAFMIGSGVVGDICAVVSSGLTVSSPTRLCVTDGTDGKPTNLVGYLVNGSVVNSGLSNAHFYSRETDIDDSSLDYAEVCYDNINCRTVDKTTGECSANEECLFSFGDGTTNAHVASCDYYDNIVCCSGGEPVCGNGIVEGGEQCDDGNIDDGDGCSSSCSDELGDPDEDGYDTCGDDGVCGTGDDDNCADHPNGPLLGTCTTGPDGTPIHSNLDLDEFTICTSDSDCSGLTPYCELSQANEDGPSGGLTGDSCGNACDIDSTDKTTCAGLGDQGSNGNPNMCTIALQNSDFVWSASTVERGTEVGITLNLHGNTACDGDTFIVNVINNDAEPGDADYLANVAPNPLTVNGASGSTNWNAENNNPSSNDVIPNANWIVKGFNLGGNVAPPSGVLVVTAELSFCGDGDLDENAGEQCDDGNTENGDDCSENCLDEGFDGPGGNGDDCNTYCVENTIVCTDESNWEACLRGSNGCLNLVPGGSCGGGEYCSAEFGNCVPDSCEVVNQPSVDNPSCPSGSSPSYVCGGWSDCINGQKSRNCVSCSSSNECPLPTQNTSCALEPAVKGSVFDFMSWILALIVLGLFYMHKSGGLKIRFG
ncbi:MAG: hypothetical protein Q8Q42_01445 [Nanoarchaeota archaeon]|nr:hypothetical protein [Nanoarchaeota archaeon]